MSVTETIEGVGISEQELVGEVLRIFEIFDLVSVLGGLCGRFPCELVVNSRSLKLAFT